MATASNWGTDLDFWPRWIEESDVMKLDVTFHCV